MLNWNDAGKMLPVSHYRDATLVLPKERQLILKLGHMIIKHTNQGMRVFPSAMVAALVLQNPGGVARSKSYYCSHSSAV